MTLGKFLYEMMHKQQKKKTLNKREAKDTRETLKLIDRIQTDKAMAKKRQTAVHKTQNRKLKTKQHEQN